MYKLIVVDDEKVIRNGIRDYLDWEKMNFEVVALFEDGKEAIEYIEKHDVDVVLTDIEMTDVSGLKLAKYIHENHMRQKVVIISGYKEFEYARQALQYGVEHYLLKPIKLEEVTAVFSKLSDMLDQEKKVEKRVDLEAVLPELTDQFFVEALLGGVRDAHSMSKKIEVLGLPINIENPYIVVDLKIMNQEEILTKDYNGGNFRNFIQNICGQEMEGILYYPVILSDNIIKTVITPRQIIDVESFENKVKEQLFEKSEAAKALLHVELGLKIEGIFKDIMGISKVGEVRLKRKNDEVSYELSEADKVRLTNKYKLILESIHDGDFATLDLLVDSMFFELKRLPIIWVKQLCIDMFATLSGKLFRMGIHEDGVSKDPFNYEEIMNSKDEKELKEVTKSLLDQLIKKVNKKQNQNTKSLINEAVEYMKENFNKDISLESVANRFFLNQAYFSRLFKQYVGMTFTDLIIEMRMEKAKDLLSEGRLKIYEVSKQVGYGSEKYFSRVFKQYTGSAPSDYIRRGVNGKEG